MEYCISHRIIAYCLLYHTTHLLQPLDVGLFSPLQKAYGQEIDRLTRFGNVAINKGNFLPLLVKARTQTYTKSNIVGAWRGSGLIPSNPRTVLTKLPTYQDPEKPQSNFPPPIPPTPRNSTALLHKARQAKLLLKRKDQDLDREELAEQPRPDYRDGNRGHGYKRGSRTRRRGSFFFCF